jgi:hypothetical protein
MNDPVKEGMILGCVQKGIDPKFVPAISKLVFLESPTLKKASDMARRGELDV